MAKISIIGAGNVGATAAKAIINLCGQSVSEIVLLDIREGFAEGKAIDIAQSLYPSCRGNCKVIGVTSNYDATANSDIIIITSGSPRKPGMTREELVGVNAKVVTSVLDSVQPLSPDAKYIMVSNPLDTMTYLAVRHLYGKVPSNRIVGMGGILDSSRLAYYVSQKTGVSMDYIDNCYVIGGHGDKTMVPLVSQVSVDGKKLTDILSKEEIDEIVESTMKGGATLTGLIGTSAWEAPAEAIAFMVEMMLHDYKEMIPCSFFHEGYNICIGGIVSLTPDGVGEYVDVNELTEEERDAFCASVEAVKKVNEALNLE